jgi:hypothetical protein
MNPLLFDMGLPMIVPAMFLMILGLMPIILVEAYVISKKLGLVYTTVLGSSALGNIVSTLVGIPVTWFVLFGIQLATGGSSSFQVSSFWEKLFAVTLQAPWLLPGPRSDDWMVYAAMLFLLIPFFFASWYIEYVVVRGRLAKQLYSFRTRDHGTQPDGVPVTMTRDGYLSEISIAIRNANLWSYALLALSVLAMFFFS